MNVKAAKIGSKPYRRLATNLFRNVQNAAKQHLESYQKQASL